MHLAPSLDLDFDLRPVSTIEEQTIVFSELSGIAIPSLVSGTLSFLRDYGRWMHQSSTHIPPGTFPIFVPPNPTNGLVFPTPLEDLKSALLVAKEKSVETPTLQETLGTFMLAERTAHQPTYTLSGGERALFVLAKASILLPAATSAVICSPARWLHVSKRYLVQETLRRCSNYSDTRILLYLDGEFDDGESPVNNFSSAPTLDDAAVEWNLVLSKPVIVFPTRHFPDEVAEKRITFSASTNPLRLNSPTILRGDNGVGKSTFAKLAAGLLRPAFGACRVSSGNFDVKPRLLFQDTPEQLFGLNPDDHLKWISDFDKERRKEAFRLSTDIQTRVADILKGFGEGLSIGSDSNTNTLVQARVILAAERLVSGTKMLILDEPTWGLSRNLALAFLAAVIENAHKRQIALLVISHEEHFPESFFRSGLLFERSDTGNLVTVRATDP